MTDWTELHLEPQTLARHGLPDIAYPVRSRTLQRTSDKREGLPMMELLFGLQEHSQNGDADWRQMEAAMDHLARCLMADDPQEVVPVSGDNWWLEIGPVDLNGKLVTIQRGGCLIAAMAPREDGRLRVAVFRPLDAKSVAYLIGLGLAPHPEHGVCMRENNWEYALDNSVGSRYAYADARGEAYLSYWEKGLGISWDGTEIPEWRRQVDLTARQPALVATELACPSVCRLLSGDEERNPIESCQSPQEAVPAQIEAKPTDWKTEPLPSRKATLRLDRTFSFEDMNRIRLGLIPEAMEDKWFIYWKDDTLFLHRSWTGYCIYVVRFVPVADGYRMVEADVNRNPDQYKETRDETDAKMIAFLIDLLLLHQNAVFPCDDPPSNELVLANWGLVGRAMLAQHPGAAKRTPPMPKTSRTSPLRIAEIQLGDCEGRLGLTLCPGKKDDGRGWDRDLDEDLRVIRDWGATVVVSLIEPHEFDLLRVPGLAETVARHDMHWFHLPIRDVDIPDERFELGWQSAGPAIHQRLQAGERILIHCRGGLGRTGLLAALILVERGSDPREAIRRVRAARPGAIETTAQEQYVLKTACEVTELRARQALSGSDDAAPIANTEASAPPMWRGKRQQQRTVRGRFLGCLLGCLLGGAVGDALGAPVEFMSRAEILKRFGPGGITSYAPAYGGIGTITDDTQMTLFTAEGLLRGWVRGVFKGITSYPGVTDHAYQRWLMTQGERSHCGSSEDGWLFQQRPLHNRRAPGNTCLSALRGKRHFGEPARNDSKGCGGVMRVAPVGLFAWSAQRSPQETFQLGAELAALTHGHPTGILTAGVLATLILALTDGISLPEALTASKAILRSHADHDETLHAIERAEALARSGLPHEEAIARLGRGWIAEEALAIAIYCALVARNFRQGVILAVNHDGDSDSTGAIVGNLMGAMHGVKAIPAEWLEPLELRDVITKLAVDLHEFASWPIDAYHWEKYPGR